jgi:anti-anti-sigma factor
VAHAFLLFSQQLLQSGVRLGLCRQEIAPFLLIGGEIKQVLLDLADVIQNDGLHVPIADGFARPFSSSRPPEWDASSNMSIQIWSENVILANLTAGREHSDELQTALAMVRGKSDCNVVVDFCNIDVVGSTTLAGLLELRQVLQPSGHKLVLCGLRPAIKGLFTIVRLDSAFDFVEDRFAALAKVQMIG